MAATLRAACCSLAVASRAVAPARAVLAARCMTAAADAAARGAGVDTAGRGVGVGVAAARGAGVDIAGVGVVGRGEGCPIIIDSLIGMASGLRVGDTETGGGMWRGVGVDGCIAGAGDTGV